MLNLGPFITMAKQDLVARGFSGLTSGMARIRNYGDRKGISAGPAGPHTVGST